MTIRETVNFMVPKYPDNTKQKLAWSPWFINKLTGMIISRFKVGMSVKNISIVLKFGYWSPFTRCFNNLIIFRHCFREIRIIQLVRSSLFLGFLVKNSLISFIIMKCFTDMLTQSIASSYLIITVFMFTVWLKTLNFKRLL